MSEQIVYQRRGTRIIYPHTEVNAKDETLIPMTVKEAIAAGLITLPDKDEDSSSMDNDERKKFEQAISELEKRLELSDRRNQELLEKLEKIKADEAEDPEKIEVSDEAEDSEKIEVSDEADELDFNLNDVLQQAASK